MIKMTKATTTKTTTTKTWQKSYFVSFMSWHKNLEEKNTLGGGYELLGKKKKTYSCLHFWELFLLNLDFKSKRMFHRGLSGVVVFSVEMSCLHWTWVSPYSGFQLIYIDIGFHLKSGFKKRWSTQTTLFTFNLIWQKSYLNRQFLYQDKTDEMEQKEDPHCNG